MSTATQSRPLPILLGVHALGPGGTERQVTELAKQIDRRRFQPHVACFNASGFRASELKEHGVPVLELPLRSLLNTTVWHSFTRLRAYVRDNGIRLVHAFDPPSNIFFTPAARLIGVRAVLSSQRCYRELVSAKHRPLLSISDRLSSLVTVNCKAIQTHLIQDYDVPARKVRVCYNALDLKTFHPRSRARMPGLEDASLVIGTVAVLRPEKDLPTIMRAFAQMAQPSYRLVIVGNGPERADLEQLAVQLNISAQCLFRDSTPDVADWLRSMDVFVLSSRSEALSNALMEAMACGCCAIASDVGGNPELVLPGSTGLLYPVGDVSALATALRRAADPSIRCGLAGTGAAYVADHFSSAKMIAEIEAVYTSLLDYPRLN